MTSVLTCPDWLDLACPLTASHDRLTLAGSSCGQLMSRLTLARPTLPCSG